MKYSCWRTVLKRIQNHEVYEKDLSGKTFRSKFDEIYSTFIRKKNNIVDYALVTLFITPRSLFWALIMSLKVSQFWIMY